MDPTTFNLSHYLMTKTDDDSAQGPQNYLSHVSFNQNALVTPVFYLMEKIQSFGQSSTLYN